MRKRRRDVVVIEGLKLPRSCRSATYNSKYCSLFFRPWTLLQGDIVVPHLNLLGLCSEHLHSLYTSCQEPQQTNVKTLLRGRQSSVPGTVNSRLPVTRHIAWPAAWSEYVRGNVVSLSACNLIQSFLLNTLGTSGKNEGLC